MPNRMFAMCLHVCCFSLYSLTSAPHMVREGQHVGYSAELRYFGNVPPLWGQPLWLRAMQDPGGKLHTTHVSPLLTRNETDVSASEAEMIFDGLKCYTSIAPKNKERIIPRGLFSHNSHLRGTLGFSRYPQACCVDWFPKDTGMPRTTCGDGQQRDPRS